MKIVIFRKYFSPPTKCPTFPEPTFFFVGDGRSPIATREIYTTPKNQIKMKNRMPSRVDAFVYKTRVTTNVWRSGARIPTTACSFTRQYLVANTRTGEASRASSTSNADTRRDAVGDLSEGSRGDRLVRWLEEPKHLSTFFLSFFFFGCSCGSVGVGLQTQDYSVVTSTTQKSHNLESSIQSRSVAALLLESG